MNYQLIHNQIIERAQNRILEGYSENHHIIPKSMGGTDKKENLVSLTAREHFIIHKLLTIIYPSDSKLHWAAFMMAGCSGNKKQDRNYRVGAREYQRLKENLKHTYTTEQRKAISKRMKGKQYRLGTEHSAESKQKISDKAKGRISKWKGKHHSDESKKKLSIAALNRPSRGPHTEETKKRMSETWAKKKEDGYVIEKGYKHTEEAKQKITESKLGVKRKPYTKEHMLNLGAALKGKAVGKIWITDGINNTTVRVSNENDIPAGWKGGMTRNK
tara:strand:- start:288 stop:1106 length:819 start_codon:yes stop_codon:yes gene_type:complete